MMLLLAQLTEPILKPSPKKLDVKIRDGYFLVNVAENSSLNALKMRVHPADVRYATVEEAAGKANLRAAVRYLTCSDKSSTHPAFQPLWLRQPASTG